MRNSEVLIAIGSNLGDRESYIRKAIEFVQAACGPILKRAALYATAPIGNATEEFLNTAIICKTALQPEQLLKALLDIEKTLGRYRSIHWGNRTIDLDVILFKQNDKQITFDSENLKIPHPYALERAFVLAPACDIAGDWVHPATELTLLAEMKSRGFKRPHSKDKPIHLQLL